jgi:hypothetical protein
MGVKSSIILIEVSRIDYTHTHTQLLPENLCVLDLFAAQNSIYVLQLDLVLHSAKNLSASSDGLERAVSREPYQRVASTPDHISSSLPAYATKDDNQESEPCKAVCLPDLNMMPSEEDSSSETLYGMS